MNNAAVQVVPDLAARVQGLVNTGAKFFGEGQLEPARLHFLAALSLDPHHPTALQNLGATLRNLNHYAASQAVARRSVKITKGENPWCLSNLGVAQLGARNYEASAETLRKVLDTLTDSAPSWHNYGLVLYMMGRYEEALEAFEKSLSLNVDPHCLSDKSLTLLALGRIQEGLDAYEGRWDILHRNKIWSMDIPEWKGEPLEGQRLLMHHEQGFGDSLMLVRFLHYIAILRAHITLAVPKPLVRLFARNYPFVKIIDLDEEFETKSFDYHSPMLSVMRHLGIAKPKDIHSEPYLKAEAKSPMNLPTSKIKIGICWASGDHSPILVDRRRLVPVTMFLPLLDNLDVALISLQKGNDVKDLVNNGLEGLIFDVSSKLEDFADTANTIMCLDLVISVDSAVAHLAGALGKPCLMLSPYTRCWRWWGRSTGWPWYQRMKIYHQSADGTWGEAMKAVTEKALWVIKDMR